MSFLIQIQKMGHMAPKLKIEMALSTYIYFCFPINLGI